MAEAVHRRIGHVGQGAVQQHRVVQAERAQGDAGHVIQHQHEVAEVFVVEDGLHRDRQRRDQHILRQQHAEQREQIQAGLQRHIAAEQLDQHPAHHRHQQQHGLQADQGQGLGRQRQPARHRQRVQHQRHARFALAPDHLAGIEGGDDQQEQREHVADQFQHHVGERIGFGAEHGAKVERADRQHQHAGQRDHGKIDVLDRFAQVEPGRFQQQEAEAARHEVRRLPGVGGRLAGACRGFAFAASGRAPGHGAGHEAEAPVAEQQHDQREGRPDQAVRQVDAFEGDQARIAFGDGPVLRQADQGGGAEGVDQRRQRLVIEVARSEGATR